MAPTRTSRQSGGDYTGRVGAAGGEMIQRALNPRCNLGKTIYSVSNGEERKEGFPTKSNPRGGSMYVMLYFAHLLH